MAATNDMREAIRSLEIKVASLEKKVDQLPTRAEWSGFATKDDLTKFATKDDFTTFSTKHDFTKFATKDDFMKFATKHDFTKFATKDDLTKFATKDDLTKFATKDDLTKFATKDDLTKFATRDDLVEFKDEIIGSFRVLAEDAKDSVKKAAEGYGATLDRIEADLGELNRKVDIGFSDHHKTLANHNERLVALERRRRGNRRG